MKILRFNDDQIGVIKNDNMVVDVSTTISARKAKGPQRVMEEIIDGWRKYRKRFEKVLAEQDGVPLASVQLLSPLARPGKFLAAFSNYIDRPERTADNFPNEYFYKSRHLVGPNAEVELRDIPSCVVYQPEAEFAFVIGKTAKDVTEKQALDHVFGYVPMFDISTRGTGAAHPFVGKARVPDGCCGPWIITKDEIPDPHNVNVKSWTNGEPRRTITPAPWPKIPIRSPGRPVRRSTPATLSPPGLPKAWLRRIPGRHHRDRVCRTWAGRNSKSSATARAKTCPGRPVKIEPAPPPGGGMNIVEEDGMLEADGVPGGQCDSATHHFTTPTLHYSNPSLLHYSHSLPRCHGSNNRCKRLNN